MHLVDGYVFLLVVVVAVLVGDAVLMLVFGRLLRRTRRRYEAADRIWRARREDRSVPPGEDSPPAA